MTLPYTVSCDSLAKALNIHRRSLQRAYHSDPFCRFTRRDLEFSLPRIARALHAEPQFLIDCIEGHDIALKRKDVARHLRASPSGIDLLTSTFGILRPALKRGPRLIRYSRNSVAPLGADKTLRKARRTAVFRDAFLEGGAA